MERTSLRRADGLPSTFFRRSLILAVVLQFFAHLVTLSPGVTPSDGPEIATAVVTLGVIHPTGYPLFTLVAHVFTWLPIPVEPVVKIEVMNALCIAGASAFAAAAVRWLALSWQGLLPPVELGLRQWWPRKAEPDTLATSGSMIHVSPRATWEADLAGILAGVLLGIGPLAWEQLRIPEVYAMHVLLVTAALYCWTRFEVTRQPRFVLWAALPMGLGLAHHVTMVYMLPVASVYLVLRRPYGVVAWFVAPTVGPLRVLGWRKLLHQTDFRHWWVAWGACLVGGAPLLFYGYFLWANANTTGVSWGEVDNWHSLHAHMTGRQYRGYMKGFEYSKFWDRVAGVPRWFDKHYLVGAMLPWLVGLLLVLRRAWPFALFLVGYGLVNIYHGAQYSVGDYRTYYLPAFSVCSLLLGFGFWWIAHRVCYRPEGRTAVAWGLVVASVLLVIAGSVYYYGHYAKPRPSELPRSIDTLVVWPLVAVSVGLAVAPLAWRARRGRTMPARRYPGLSLVVLGMIGLVYAGVATNRGIEFFNKSVGGASYAAGVVKAVPPGGVYITIGDGKSFPMWYSQHVLNEGREFAVVDDRMIHRSWYRRNYLARRHPVGCDPMDPRYIEDLERFFDECGNYGQRLDIYEQDEETWLKLDVSALRSFRRTKRPQPLDLRIKHGGDKRCQKSAYRRKNSKKCACWDYNEYRRAWDLQCVYTSEEQAIVRMDKREIYAHRIIEDHIDERPVFEGNVFTRRLRRAKNGRGWSGPAYRRVSGQYHLINRGRANQVFYWADVEGIDTCAGDQLAHLPQPERSPARSHKIPNVKRTPYQINERPQLMRYSLLTPWRSTSGDDEKYEYGLDEDVHLSMRWFERNYYDPNKKHHQGGRVRHGVRVCFFGPDGEKIHTTSTLTVNRYGQVYLPHERTTKLGTYTVQACTVGQMSSRKGKPGTKDSEVPDDLPCLYPVLEYTFDVVAG